ncbi:MAG: YfiR family protein [Opitutaceae bacterium]
MPKDAHILLVTRAAGIAPERIREAPGSAPTLLIGETEQFAERGGSVAFVSDRQSIRMTLCPEPSRRKQRRRPGRAVRRRH